MYVCVYIYICIYIYIYLYYAYIYIYTYLWNHQKNYAYQILEPICLASSQEEGCVCISICVFSTVFHDLTNLHSGIPTLHMREKLWKINVHQFWHGPQIRHTVTYSNLFPVCHDFSVKVSYPKYSPVIQHIT